MAIGERPDFEEEIKKSIGGKQESTGKRPAPTEVGAGGGGEADWRRTKYAEARLAGSPFYEEPDRDREAPHGYYAGRRIIGRDTPINEGVYLGASGREAIVVDDKKSELLRQTYVELHRRLNESSVVSTEIGVLAQVYEITREVMPFNKAEVEKITREFPQDQKINLGVFIERRAGVCRHQALLASYLLERLIRDGQFRGKVSVDRNTVPGRGGHAWMRYENLKGQVSVIDPAQGYIGRIENVPSDRWFYERPKAGS